MIVLDRLQLVGDAVLRMHEANYADTDSESRATWTVPSDAGALFQAYLNVCEALLRGMGLNDEQARKVREHLFDAEVFTATQVGIILVRDYDFQWAPTEGCEDCELYHTLCPECYMYGEHTALVSYA